MMLHRCNKLGNNNNKFTKYAENMLEINDSKTTVLLMHTWQTKNLVPPKIQIKSIEVNVNSNGKLLGVQITDTMNTGITRAMVGARFYWNPD
jgi:arginyl-tRNA--protein-N-Asp/Glu arginylyltransferase